MNLTYFVISWKLVQNNKNYLYSMKSHLNKISEINLVFLEFERDLISGKLWLWLAPQVTLCPLCPKLLVRVQQPGDGDLGQNVNLNKLTLPFTHSRPFIESWKKENSRFQWNLHTRTCTLNMENHALSLTYIGIPSIIWSGSTHSMQKKTVVALTSLDQWDLQKIGLCFQMWVVNI